MRPNFGRTVAILVKAYLNNTLEHGNCCACAVGNLIADSLGFKYVARKHSLLAIKWKDGQQPDWYCELYGVRESKQTIATGYSAHELQRIEMAFECVSIILPDGERMFMGLMNVVETLAEIHNVDLSQKEQAKLLFHK